ncbi:MAG: hypothetical protein CO125_03800 [Hydrogenophilales bacterium CG_4_9_14_3_um_filter_59_35]|nr:MAG: hypothetical protein COW70_13070 [Hydrogenophilales bacterium CG18_big_fil_WC_8_21_14_2_50_58_12]PIX98537.1 MAG: hypothetical protein COZ23_13875 [Hydrogenophilales bacterium CG_4_10_14_3_um_filter_58_23]PJB07829.1 MAG: hypothetical protein CO125_03800 [Hydrogenophilales bacterium CG_4_9_14_3_um_filter_59_35]
MGLEMLLWSIKEVAQQLGDISTRSVRRMIERGDLPTVPVGRRVTVPSDAVRAWVEQNIRSVHNYDAGQGVQKEGTCQNAKEIRTDFPNVLILRTTGRPTPTQTARELDALLESANRQKAGKKLKHF